MRKLVFLFGILLISGIIFEILKFLAFNSVTFEKSKVFPSEMCYENISLKVHGSSLEPIIKEGENVILMKNYYTCHKIKINDIVAYNFSGKKYPLIKIVKALPGDILEFKGCYLLRNGEVIKNSMGKPYCFTGSRREMLKLYTGRELYGYLLLGNKITGSLDSSVFGIVSKEDIIGKISK